MRIEFTKHSLDQMRERGISQDDVMVTIKYPEKTEKIKNRYYVQRKTIQGKIEVVYLIENYIKVITVYPI